MIKAEFSASLLQSSVSHDPSEIILICWFAAQETFLIINVENSCAASYFSQWKLWNILIFKIPWLIESLKEQHLFETEIFCNIINVFTVTFNQINKPKIGVYGISFVKTTWLFTSWRKYEWCLLVQNSLLWCYCVDAHAEFDTEFWKAKLAL